MDPSSCIRMTLSWKRAIGRPAPVPGKTYRPLKPYIANLRSSYDRGLQHNYGGSLAPWHEVRELTTWYSHEAVSPWKITPVPNHCWQKWSVLPNSTPETHHRKKHWLETMLSSIKSSARISIWTFALIRPSKIIFSAFRYDSGQFGFRLRAQFLCCTFKLGINCIDTKPQLISANVQGPWSVPFTRGVTFYGHRSTLWFSWTLNFSCRSAPRRIFHLGPVA